MNGGLIDRYCVVCYIWINMVCWFSVAELIIVPQNEFTQAGCNVTIKCAAEDPYIIEWSTRRTDFRFTNTSRRFTWVSVACEMLVEML